MRWWHKITPDLRSKLIAGSISALLTAGVGWLLIHERDPLYVGKILERQSYNFLYRFKDPVKIDDVIMVWMDEYSHRQLKQPYNASWDRSLYAGLLDKLTEGSARAVAFDIVFSDPHPTKPEGDMLLAAAIKKNGRVILGGEDIEEEQFDEATGTTNKLASYIRAYTPFYKAAAIPLAIVLCEPDPDLMIRRHAHVSPFETNKIPRFASISWSLAKFLGAPAAQQPERLREPRWINYYGPPGTIAKISFLQALSNAPPSLFSNKVVFVGAKLNTHFSGERKDEYATPYKFLLKANKGEELVQFIGGVEVQATQFLNLKRGDWLRRWEHRQEATIIVLAGLAFGLGLIFFRPFIALMVGGVLIGGVVAAARLLFLEGLLYFPFMIITVAQIPFAALVAWGFNSFRLYVNNRLLEQSLSSYVSPARVKEVLQQPDKLKPGAEKTELSILFSDIAGFTSISEGMDSDELARIMNAYFEGAVSRIHETDGTVVKFIGDAIFAIWNAPLLQADHQYHAALAGLRLSGAVDEFIKSGGPELITRIGLHCGVANVGNFGSTKRFDYTAIGENINLASRMESLNKYLGTTVLGTGDIQAVVGDRLVWRYIGKFQLKGFDRAVAVFELVGEPKDAETSRAWREEFSHAFAAFLQRDFATAKSGFEKVVAMRGKDGPSNFYLKYLEEHPHPPGPDWNGDIEMKEK